MKKGRKTSVPNSTPDTQLKWEQGLIQAQLQEEKWRVCIALLIENKLEDAVNVNCLISAITTGSRRLFEKVTRQDLFREVFTYGNPKSRPKDVPLFAEVCESCKNHLDDKEEIPEPLLAKLIKFKLLAIKAEDIKRRESTTKAANSNDPDPEKSKPDKDKAQKGAGKKGAAKKTTETPSAKQGTLLKKRSEENLDQKFIDDEPDDGPQRYIILSSFYNTKLLTLLSELDVQIDTVIRYGCSDYDRFLVIPPEKDDSLSKDSKLIAPDETAIAENMHIKTGTETFWKEIYTLLKSQPVGSPLFHTHVQEIWIQEPMPYLEKAEVQALYGAGLFDNFAHVLYELVDSKRQYKNYIKNMKIINVPDIAKIETSHHQTGPVAPEISTTETHIYVDMRYYNDLMDTIPLESVTIPLVVHCLIEQIVATEEHIEPPSEKTLPPTADGLHQEVAKHLAETIQQLSLDQECLSSVADMIPGKKVPDKEKVKMINCKDMITKKLHHLTPFYDFDPEKVETKMLQEYSSYNGHLFPEVSDLEKQTLSARTQEFLHFCSKLGLSMEVVDRVLCQHVLECILTLNVNADGTMESSPPISLIAWDYPYKYLEERQWVNPEGPAPSSEANLQESYEDMRTLHNSPTNLKTNFIRQKNQNITPQVKNNQKYTSSQNLDQTYSIKYILSDEAYWKQTIEHGGNFAKPPISEVMESILKSRQRNLTNWDYIEHFKPKILQQVLSEASYNLPYCEKYYHHQDNCIYIVHYNPYNDERWNKESWKIQLHSNVGFRNYMMHVAANIQDWIQEEENNYEELLDSLQAAKIEQQKIAQAEAALAEKVAEAVTKDGKRAPAKKSPPAQNKSPTKQEQPSPPEGDFIRPGSLKAQKRDEEFLKLEEEEKEKNKKASKKGEQPEAKKPNRSPVTSPKPTKPIKSTKEENNAELEPSMVTTVEKELPFTGYDMGNNIICLTANKYTLFPSDGAQIRVETREYLYGCQNVTCSVVRNGHVFSVHLLNLRDPEEKELSELHKEAPSSEKNGHADSAASAGEENVKTATSDSEKRSSTEENAQKKTNSSEQETESILETKYSDFGSISAVLSDGMTLSFSKFGPTGYHPSLFAEKEKSSSKSPKASVAECLESRPTLHSVKETAHGRGKKTKTKRIESIICDEIKGAEHEVKPSAEELSLPAERSTPPQPAFQHLYITCPDGLKVEYSVESAYGIEHASRNENQILVKQSYPFRNYGIQPCEATRNKHAYLEQHRIITSDGTVIKKMKDGTFEILYADGTVIKHECDPTDKVNPDTCTDNQRSSIVEKVVTFNAGEVPKVTKKEKWTVTHPSGQRFLLSEGKKVDLPKVFSSIKSDIKSGQTFVTRDDHVIILHEMCGNTVVEHNDGTRITTSYEESAQETLGMPFKKTLIKIECPSFATVKFDCKTNENLTLLANGMLISVFPDGYYSLLLAGEIPGDRLYLDLHGTFFYTTSLVDYLSSNSQQRETTYTFKHYDNTICKTVDPDGTIFKVDHKGQHTIIKGNQKKRVFMNGQEHSEIAEYKRHPPRIFVLHPDGSGGEILPNEKVKNYLFWAEQDPECIIQKDVLKDQLEMFGITLLKPYRPFSDSWLRQYEVECILPESMHLKTSVDTVKADINSAACPDILEIRQFTQYPHVSRTNKKAIEQGLHNYIDYCFNRHKLKMELQIEDNRPEQEKTAAESLQENVKQYNLNDKIKPKMKINEAKELYKRRITSIKSITFFENKLKVKKKSKQNDYYNEEEMAKRALRNNEIPKYFDSMFGKTFLETEKMNPLNGQLKRLSDFPVLQLDSVKNVNPQMERADQKKGMSPGTKANDHNNYHSSRKLCPVDPSPPQPAGNASLKMVQPMKSTTKLQKSEPMQDMPVVNTLNTRGRCKNLHVNVNGQPRAAAVPVPTSLAGGRTGSIPNEKFQMVEEPVRRRVQNSLTIGSTTESQWRLQMMRGFNLYPEEINFGILCEGNSYLMSVNLINTGIDSCHFKVKQPPPATGLKVTYQPGPVAAGLKRKLHLELFAVASGVNTDAGIGSIKHNLCITTETNVLHLPIQATILTCFEYERQKDAKLLDINSSPAKLISTPGRQGITQRKKESSNGKYIELGDTEEATQNNFV